MTFCSWRGLTRAMSAPRSLILTPTEQTFIQHLERFSRTLDPPIECRIAGGWVRDKILSIPSSDLDIALPLASGHSFATEFVDYLRGQGVSITKVGRVPVNPEQSKHLETGTTRILGLECDFVGLRSETYSESRIPTEVRLGTPLEDALRRDLTINALFYNIHSKEVEDFTRRGLSDLTDRIARTPLPPRQTFLDDPLRVVRCVRFASLFDLSIDNDARVAIQDKDIQAALRSKVSKERVGIEVMKIIKRQPLRGLILIDQLNLHASIFSSPLETRREVALRSGQILQSVLERVGEGGDEILWLAAALSPFHGLVVPGKKSIAATSLVVSDSLKLSNEIRIAVTNLESGVDLIHTEATKRSAIGLTIRHPLVRPWRRTWIWAIVRALLPVWSGTWDGAAVSVLDRYEKFAGHLEKLNLEAAIDCQPLLNGKEIQGVLGVEPGPVVQIIRDSVLAWQLDHPDRDKADCMEWLKAAWTGDEGGRWRSESAAKRKH